MAPALDALAAQIVESGLISSGQLLAIRAQHQPNDAEALARLLVKQMILTAYQAQQAYAGKSRSLVLGNYIILDKLGQGGMGMVLKARHRRMNRIVALKVLSPSVTKSPDALKRFQREVEAAAKLHHANIVTAHDADEVNGTHFLVMEYIEGADLAALVKNNGPLPVDQAIDCLLQAARGLDYAHRHGVIHRDIKPANLLLDNQGTIKILDMGLARIEGETGPQAELTGTGAVMGTVDYMAPEQAVNTKAADARSDIYSLGISLWYLLTARPAYEGDSLIARLLAHRGAPPPSLKAARGEVPAALDDLFQKMIAKQANDRCQSMAEVTAALETCQLPEARSAKSTAVPDRPQSAVLAAPSAGSEYDAMVTAGHATEAAAPQPSTSLSSRFGRMAPDRPPWWKNRAVQLACAVAAVMVVGVVLWPPGRNTAKPTATAITPASSKNVGSANEEAGSSPKPTLSAPVVATAIPDERLEHDDALRFSAAGDAVETPAVLLPSAGPWTVEAWVTPLGTLPPGGQSELALMVDPVWIALRGHPEGPKWAAGGPTSRPGSTRYSTGMAALAAATHLAIVRRPEGGVSLFVNGVEEGSPLPIVFSAREAQFRIVPPGKPQYRDLPFQGDVDEVRVSSSVRYPGPFEPERRFEPDAQTAALYHCDDAQGDTLKDSSGHNRHGKIIGAKWRGAKSRDDARK